MRLYLKMEYFQVTNNTNSVGDVQTGIGMDTEIQSNDSKDQKIQNCKDPKRQKNREIRKGLLWGILAAVVVIVLGTALGLQMLYAGFYQNATRGFAIPGLETGFVPQGLAYNEDAGVFLMSGYIHPQGNAEIYVIRPSGEGEEAGTANGGEESRKIALVEDNGDPLINHAGGIACAGSFVYLAGCDGKCYVFDGETLLSETAVQASPIGSFETNTEADFCFADGEKLYIGEYYHSIKYPTRQEHHLTTPHGERNPSVVMVYALDEGAALGVAAVPESAISIPERVQGIAMTDEGKLLLSASSVLQGSQLYTYDYALALQGETGSLEVDGQSIPVHYADGSTLVSTLEMPPKSEGIALRDGRAWLLFESAAKRFGYGKLFGAQYGYSLPLAP